MHNDENVTQEGFLLNSFFLVLAGKKGWKKHYVCLSVRTKSARHPVCFHTSAHEPLNIYISLTFYFHYYNTGRASILDVHFVFGEIYEILHIWSKCMFLSVSFLTKHMQRKITKTHDERRKTSVVLRLYAWSNHSFHTQKQLYYTMRLKLMYTATNRSKVAEHLLFLYEIKLWNRETFIWLASTRVRWYVACLANITTDMSSCMSANK